MRPQLDPTGHTGVGGILRVSQVGGKMLHLYVDWSLEVKAAGTWAIDLLEGAGVRASVLKGGLGGTPVIYYACPIS